MIKLVDFDSVFLKKSIEWLNDDELVFLINAKKPSPEEQEEWFKSLNSRNEYFIWGVLLDSKPIGAAGLKHINYAGHSAEYFGYIGEKEYWSKGFGTYMVQGVFGKARELSINRVYLHVNMNNKRAISLYLKLGFKILTEQNGKYMMEIALSDM